MANQPSYHKGNLKEKLIRESARLISEEGIDQLSMRHLAARLEVSRAAAYHHFKNKEDLLNQVARQGFTLLHEHLRTALSATPDAPQAQLRAIFHAYVSFAVSETDFFRLMFADLVGRDVDPGENHIELAGFRFSSTEALEAFAEISDILQRLQANATIHADSDVLTLTNTIWAVVHGVAVLRVDNQLKLCRSLEEFTDEVCDMLLRGLAPVSSPSRKERPSRNRQRG